MSKILLAIAFSLLGYTVPAQTYEPAHFLHGGTILPYRYLKPESVAGNKLPLLIFLHGAGERGSDNEKQLIHGGSLFSDSLLKYPALILFPQCAEDGYWANVEITAGKDGRQYDFKSGLEAHSPLTMVRFLIDSLIADGGVDTSRIYVGGLSMGAMGAYALAEASPHLFAAAFAICGGGNTKKASKYARHTPFWIFHGAQDDIVPWVYSYRMYTALKEAGGNPVLTIYPAANHNSWDAAFAEDRLLQWLFSNHKTNL